MQPQLIKPIDFLLYRNDTDVDRAGEGGDENEEEKLRARRWSDTTVVIKRARVWHVEQHTENGYYEL
jgi:hypothetical protein